MAFCGLALDSMVRLSVPFQAKAARSSPLTEVSEKSLAAPVAPFITSRVPCTSVTTDAVTPSPDALMAAARPV